VRILGVLVKADSSALITGALVAWVYADSFAGTASEPTGAALIVGIIAVALGFFASLLLHEMGHALASKSLGIEVRGITLFMMGGFTESSREADRPRDDFFVVVMGPIMSLVAAGLSYGVVLLDPPAPLDSVAVFLVWANLLLAVFNLVPGYPLDGGRLLRAILWGISKRPHAATRWAARVGQAFALLVVGYGGWLLATQSGFSGLWEVLLGAYLFRGAHQAHERATLRERFVGRRVRDVMGTAPPFLDPAMTLGDALEQLQERPSLLWPVGDPVVGGLVLESIDAVPDVDWHTTRVADVALATSQVVIAADASLEDALRAMSQAPRGMLLAVDGGTAVGLVTPSLLGVVDE